MLTQQIGYSIQDQGLYSIEKTVYEIAHNYLGMLAAMFKNRRGMKKPSLPTKSGMPSAPSAPSMPTAPSAPTAPTAPTAPSAPKPQVGGGGSRIRFQHHPSVRYSGYGIGNVLG